MSAGAVRLPGVRASLVALVLALLALPATAPARGHGSHASHTSSSSYRSGSSGSHRRASGVQRDAHGKIRRDPEQRRAFMRTHPCPSTGRTSGACPGYVVDHVVPLNRGGADHPGNMQWQTKEAARAKDRLE